MREIKFRAWNKREEKMYYRVEMIFNCLLSSDEDINEVCFGHLLNNEEWIVMQYTGLRDKDGMKIYEGDIITNEWCSELQPSIIRFGKYKPSDMSRYYECGNLGFFVQHLWGDLMRQDIMYFANKCEVIGNIYENPELLEESDEENETNTI